MTICDKIKHCPSMDDMASVALDYPELFFSQMGIAAILQAIPNVVRESGDQDISFHFIRNIITVYRTRMMGGYNSNVRVVKDAFQSFDHDWAYHILSTYINALLEYSKGACLSAESVRRSWEPNIGKEIGIESPYAFLGWAFFSFDYVGGNLHNSEAFESFARVINQNNEFYAGFFEILSSCCCPVSNEALRLLIDFFGRKTFYVKVEPFGRDHTGVLKLHDSLLYNLMGCDVGWFQEEVHKLLQDQVNFDLMAEMTDVFVTLSSAMQNYFITVNFFYEYITEIAYFYPLSKQRSDIAARYERYFGDDTMNYMADITSSVIEHVSKMENYRDRQTDRGVTRLVLMSVENVLLEIDTKYPNTDPNVVRCFLKDTFKAFGRGFQGYAEGLSWYADEMITTIWKQKQAAIEADIDFLTLLPSLEADDGNDQGEGNDLTSNASLHRKASTNKTAPAMKTAERKVFNAYHKYKEQEDKVDQTLVKGINTLKKAVTGDQQAILIEGKKFSPIGFLKKVLLTVGIFNYSKIAAILAIIVSSVMKGKAKKNEKRKLLMELEEELNMVNEKIEDARGDGNRQAKYDLMRTRNAIQNAIKRLKYGIGAEETKNAYHPERLRSTQNYEDTSLRG